MELIAAIGDWIQQQEPVFRLGVFVGLLGVLMLAELVVPRRESVYRRRRWLPNFLMLATDALVLRLAFPLLAVDVALLAQREGWGLFNNVPVAAWAAFVASLLLLDCLIYAQHVVMHKVPLLWRLHRVHHSDLEFDVSTAVRFHPVEIALSMGIKMIAVLALGAPAVAVIVFEVLLNATAMFNHANLRLPARLDRLLRLVVVTPDMHRVHHSWYPQETDSNFGFNLPWWDRLFGTYRDQPRDGHAAMTIGLEYFRDRADQAFRLLLIQPLRRVRNNGVHDLEETP